MSGPAPKLIAVDLDGTLVDSAPDIAHCLGAALEAVGCAPPGEARTREWIGDGLETLIARAIAHDCKPRGESAPSDEARRHAALAAFLVRFDALREIASWVLGAAAVAAAATLYVGIYLSHERIEFCTLHGRAAVLQLVANLGSIKRFHSFVPMLCRAIEEAAERIGADTSAYLRAEMREHYRLRGDGVLDNDECARGTGRILAQFDVQL